MPITHQIALGITAAYGLVSLAGGILGYVRADSMASLIAGGISGILLLLCAAGISYQPSLSLGAAIVIALALVGRFTSVLNQHRGQIGEYLASTGGIVGFVMIIGGVLVVLSAVAALMTKAGPPTGT